MGILNEVVVGVCEMVSNEKSKYIGWVYGEGEGALDKFAEIITTDYADNLQTITMMDKDAYETYSICFKHLDKLYEFTVCNQEDGEQTWCELYEVENKEPLMEL